LKQILQSFKSGKIELLDIPCPLVKKGQVLIRTNCSLISTGTERMLIDFGRAGLISKARQQPEKVRMVLEKIKTDGVLPTIQSVQAKLDDPLALGYCNVGTIKAIGASVDGFHVEERVVSNGHHAEVISAPVNLCAKIPDCVSDEEASFVIVGAIALQGIRLIGPTLGETVVVIGLGLIGQLAIQLLRANGCRVMGVDFDQKKLEIAKSFGAEVVNLNNNDLLKAAEQFSRNRGVDAVLIAAATDSNDPVHKAALMCRKRGRIVLVGSVGLNLFRDDFYKKEISFQVSASYGPGRYDSNYEDLGQDYPVGFVRWTQQRNFEAVLDMLANGKIDVKPLISHKFDLEQMNSAYELLCKDKHVMGIILKYRSQDENPNDFLFQNKIYLDKPVFQSTSNFFPNLAFLGSGNYAGSVLLPAFKKLKVGLGTIASTSGRSATHLGRKYGFRNVTTDINSLFEDESIDAVVIATRHDSHADFVQKALSHGKHVFVEKPLSLSVPDLLNIQRVYQHSRIKNSFNPILMVGYNRRFAPHIQKIKTLLLGVRGAKTFIITINAGSIPIDHWVQKIEVGGGRIIGEVCHFIDLMRFLADSSINEWTAIGMDCKTRDTASISLKFSDGSMGVINYLSNGSKSYPKEKLEVFADGGILQLDNFCTLHGYGWPGFKKMNLFRQDKGQRACAKAFTDAIINNYQSPIPAEELFEVGRISIEIAKVINKFD
jgi:predicted dehydrogenase